MTTIKERTERNEVEDKIYLGTLVEKAMKGEFGALIDCLLDGMRRAVLEQSIRTGAISAERYLGRIEAMQVLRDELTQMVQIKDQLLDEKLDDSRVRAVGE